MDRRRVFLSGAAALLALAFLALVIGPAVDRGGVQELLIIAAIFGTILLLERYLRARG
ncbi:MAG TPA: hypothetical protein VHG53_06670 [Candidatus Limnocylindria bacterium]|nr:hypothetical protein [Candidatus Limnocylindria bacterium]